MYTALFLFGQLAGLGKFPGLSAWWVLLTLFLDIDLNHIAVMTVLREIRDKK